MTTLPRLRRVRLGALAVAFVVIAAACGSSTDVYSLGSESLTRGDLNDMLVAEFPDQPDGPFDSATTAQLLTDRIMAQGFSDTLGDLGYPVTDEAVSDAANRLAEQFPEADPDGLSLQNAARFEAVDAAFQQYLDAEVGPVEFEAPEVMCASHILVETEAEAVAIGERLAAGEDFAALATELSTGPSGPDGGQLGCGPTAGYVPEFVDGARAVEAPGFTGPVESEFGWHVIEVRSFGPLSAEIHPEIPPDQVQAQLEATEQETLSLVAAPLVQELQTTTFDRIDADLDLDARYGSWVATLPGIEPPNGVTAPASPVPSLLPGELADPAGG